MVERPSSLRALCQLCVRFISFSMIGSICWIVSFITLGYFFGQLPVVKHNFTLVIFGIIGVSFAPIVFHALKAKFAKNSH